MNRAPIVTPSVGVDRRGRDQRDRVRVVVEESDRTSRRRGSARSATARRGTETAPRRSRAGARTARRGRSGATSSRRRADRSVRPRSRAADRGRRRWAVRSRPGSGVCTGVCTGRSGSAATGGAIASSPAAPAANSNARPGRTGVETLACRAGDCATPGPRAGAVAAARRDRTLRGRRAPRAAVTAAGTASGMPGDPRTASARRRTGSPGSCASVPKPQPMWRRGFPTPVAVTLHGIAASPSADPASADLGAWPGPAICP